MLCSTIKTMFWSPRLLGYTTNQKHNNLNSAWHAQLSIIYSCNYLGLIEWLSAISYIDALRLVFNPARHDICKILKRGRRRIFTHAHCQLIPGARVRSPQLWIAAEGRIEEYRFFTPSSVSAVGSGKVLSLEKSSHGHRSLQLKHVA
jgi:hypothetical protein